MPGGLSVDKQSLKYAAIETRLKLLRAEVDVLEKSLRPDQVNKYWAYLVELYAPASRQAGDGRMPRTEEIDKMLAAYRQRIGNLEKFKNLYFQTQDKLKDALNNVLNTKKELDAVLHDPDREIMEGTIEELKNKVQGLTNQLDLADREFMAIMNNLNNLAQQDTLVTLPDESAVEEQLKQIAELEEENKFLTNQIEYLLQQEVENTRKLMERIETLEATLDNKQAENNMLTQKLNELEARYLEAMQNMK